jgi:hypothetical protein
MFRALEKLLGLFCLAPPIYLLFRFLKWYVKQENAQNEQNDETEATA